MSRTLWLCALVATASTAHANVFEQFGADARAVGMAGAGVTEARGFAATHHNPAGVALAPNIEAALSYGGALTGGLTLAGASGRAESAGVTSPHGTTLGLAIPVALGKRVRIALGAAIYLPDQFLARIHIAPPGEPQFLILDNHLQRLVVDVVGSIALGEHFSLGGGAAILADAAGNGIRFQVGVENSAKVGRGAIDATLPIRAAPILGVLIRPRPWLRLGASWRGPLDLGLRLDILAQVDIAGAITGDAFISLRATNFYTPHTVSLGLGGDLGAHLRWTAQLDWQGWSLWSTPLADLRVLLDLTIAPPLVPPGQTALRFSDAWVPRVGLEWISTPRGRVSGRLRAGYAFMPSPLPPQTGVTSFADNDRHVVALGGGVQLAHLLPVLKRPLALDVALQLHELVGRTTRKDARLTAQSDFSSGGYLFYLGATLQGGF